MRQWILLSTILAGSLAAKAQVVGQNTQPADKGTYTLSVSSKLVIEAVNVKDKQGKSITGLTAKDFTVTENGVEQHISFCEYEELPTAPEAGSTKAAPENVTVYNRLAVTQIAAEKPGDARYKNKRLISMYFDLTSMPPEDKVRALQAAEKFVRTQMTSADLISIMRYGGGSVDVLQDFNSKAGIGRELGDCVAVLSVDRLVQRNAANNRMSRLSGAAGEFA
jgi:VWFA-related protein